MRTKKCKICKSGFTPYRTTQIVCSSKCAVEWQRIKTEKRVKREISQAREKLKTTRELLSEAQVIFNQFIRLRDEHEPCISCQRYHQGQYHAGHWRSVGACSSLRFHEMNVHKQCSSCNNHLSGNIVEYRIHLEKKIGSDNLLFLENSPKAARFTKDEAREIKAFYRWKLKELKKEKSHD